MGTNKILCRVAIVALVVALPGFAEAQSAAKAVVLDGRPSCPQCKIVLEKTATLLVPETAEPLGFDAIVTMNSRGVTLALAADRIHVLQFTANGKFVRQFGKLGDGPGEFRRILNMTFGPGDSLYLFEQARAHVFSPSMTLVRTRALPGQAQRVIPRKDGSFVAQMRLSTPSAAGYPLHQLDARGNVVRSFGVEGVPNVDPRCRTCRLYMLILDPSGDHVGLAPTNKYAFEIWSVSGARVGAFTVDSPWFKPWTVEPKWMTGEAPRPPTIASASTDSLGRIWIRSVRSPPAWKPGIGSMDTTGLRKSNGGVRAPLARLEEFAAELAAKAEQSVIEVIDLKRGGVVSSTTFDGYPPVVIGWPMAARQRRGPDGEFVIDLFRMRETVPR